MQGLSEKVCSIKINNTKKYNLIIAIKFTQVYKSDKDKGIQTDYVSQKERKKERKKEMKEQLSIM